MIGISGIRRKMKCRQQKLRTGASKTREMTISMKIKIDKVRKWKCLKNKKGTGNV